MEAKDSQLGILDILKIWARKFLRLAPAYYTLWLLLFVATPRIL